MEDEASNTLALLNVVIEETAEGYTARIDSFTIYEKTTNYGHFGKKDLPWEKIVTLL